MTGQWLDVMLPNIKKFEVAAAFDGSATWNAEGSKAMANLLRKMCAIIDNEIDRREQVKSTHPDKSEREKEDGEVGAEAKVRAEQMLAMAKAVAQVRTVSQLETKYGMGSVNRANVQPDASEILSVLGMMTVFMGCGMRLPEDGKPTDFFASVKQKDGPAGDAANAIILAATDMLKGKDAIHDMHMKEFGGGKKEG